MILREVYGKANSRFNNDESPWEIVAIVDFDARQWKKARDSARLGNLYLQVSNALYELNKHIPAYHPYVDHSEKARKGVKRVKLTYFLSSRESAKALGFTLLNEKYSTYGDFVKIY